MVTIFGKNFAKGACESLFQMAREKNKQKMVVFTIGFIKKGEDERKRMQSMLQLVSSVDSTMTVHSRMALSDASQSQSICRRQKNKKIKLIWSPIN